MISRIVAKLNNIPFQLEDVWFAWSAYEENINDENLIPYWDKDGKYIKYKVGDIVPVKRVGSKVAYYRIVDWEKYYGDYAGFDDGRKYTLQFHGLRTKPTQPSREEVK